ncbi:MAG: malonate decarboxylase subunit epsilon [Paenibacillaceae bacterium]
MKVVFLFPGQGSQQPGMLHDLPDHPVIMATLEEASRVLGMDVLLLDHEKALISTVATQLSLLITSVACARALRAEGTVVDMVAGHSVGAFAAAVIAGSLDFKDALPLVKLRGELMEKAYPNGYGMGVITGLTEQQIEVIINQVSTDAAPVYIANLNEHTQITIAGAIAGMMSAFTSAVTAGAHKTAMLNVHVPSHCKLLAEVSVQLSQAIDKVDFRKPNVPYAGNCRARALRDGEAIRADLAQSIIYPVRWHDAMTLYFELGGRLFIEMRPGRVLSTIVKKSFPCVRAISLCDLDLHSVTRLVTREME